MGWYVGRSLDQLLAEINASAPHRSKASDGSIGDASHSSRSSDHNPCDCHDAVCARDYTHDPGGGFDSYAFARWLGDRVVRDEPRVKYIISNGQICSGQGQEYPAGVWRNYTGSNPHDHHVHVSVRHPADLFDNAGGWGWSGAPGPRPEPEPEPVFQGVPDMFLVFDGPEAGKARFQGVQIGELTVSLTSSQYLFAVQNSEGVPNLHLDATVPDAVIANLVKATAQDIDG